MKQKYYFTAALLCAVSLCAWLFVTVYNNSHKESKREQITVVTSFYPVYIAALNVAGDCGGIEVFNLSEPQTGCLHDFQLTPEDMKLISRADVFLVNGGGMESFLGDVTEQYPDLALFETTEGLRMPDENAHVWMSVSRYRGQVDFIAERLCEISPEHAQELQANARAYDLKLAELEAQQEEILEKAKGRKIISFHDAYAYVADDYGLVTEYYINLDEERQTGAKEAADVLSAVRDGETNLIFAEEQYGRELAETVKKEADVNVYYLDTLVRGADEKDSYLDGMQKNINILKTAFGV